TDRRSAAAETAPPKAFTDEHQSVLTPTFCSIRKLAAGGRCNVEYSQQARSDACRNNALRILWLRYVEGRLHVCAEFFERTVLLSHRQIVRHRCRALIEAALWHGRPHANQPPRIRIGRRCEQHGLH